MQILFIVGSLRKKSMNLQIAREIAADLKTRYDAECPFLDYTAVPYMNEDIQFPAPEPVAQVRRIVQKADGLWFVTPEYDHGIPGPLKNLTDWLSRPETSEQTWKDSVLMKKRCAVTSIAGGSHGAFVLEAMRTVLGFCSNVMTEVMAGLEYTHEEDDTSTIQMTPERFTVLRAQEDAFIKYLGTAG